ncbi:MAG TPA: HTTM domain-containing protein [Nitrosopumilaceae archaeon]|jgi:hypothetical protein|nr:HTTM domain-containing protein [Nitrosopumilaceae archaeon]
MKTVLFKINTYFSSPAEGLMAANLFRKAVYVYLVLNAIQLFPIYGELYGSGSLIVPFPFPKFSFSLTLNLLSLPAFENYYWLFFLIQVSACVLGFFSIYPRICAVLVWFTTVNLSHRIYLLDTGGDLLLNIMVFYLLFISPERSKQSNIISNILDNTFILACKIQLIVVYALSALFKLIQPDWLNGSAMYFVLSMKEFSLPFLRQIFLEHKIILMIFTYSALLYQILFPFFIWSKRLKKKLIIAGLIMHIFIAVFIGLFNFSIVMICCYLLFTEKAFAEKCMRKIKIRL